MDLDQLDRLAFDNLTTAVLLLNAQLDIVHANPAAESLFSVSATQLQGSSFNNYLPDDTAEAELRYSLASEASYTHRETALHVPGNGTITVDFTATPIRDRLLLIEIQPMDRILQINREEALLSAQTTIQELVRGLAHEVKNPLGGIKGAAQLLSSELTDEQREFTDVIIAETERLASLVDQLLGPSRPVKIAPQNIHQITERVATLIGAEAQQRIHINRDYDPSIPEFEGDRDQLIQAVLNITRNAMQALIESDTVGGHITLITRIQRHFTIRKTHHKVVCRLDIEDNGPGIAPDIAERIFYPMISGRSQGSGLGLPLAQTIISRHQGLIECSSQPGQTRFSIFLPLEQSREQ